MIATDNDEVALRGSLESILPVREKALEHLAYARRMFDAYEKAPEERGLANPYEGEVDDCEVEVEFFNEVVKGLTESLIELLEKRRNEVAAVLDGPMLPECPWSQEEANEAQRVYDEITEEINTLKKGITK